MSDKTNFMQRCLAGEAEPDDIDDYVGEWHDGGGNLPLGDFLGLTAEEYRRWAENHATIHEAVAPGATCEQAAHALAADHGTEVGLWYSKSVMSEVTEVQFCTADGRMWDLSGPWGGDSWYACRTQPYSINTSKGRGNGR